MKKINFNKILETENLAELLDEEELNLLATQVIDDAAIDMGSRKKWYTQAKKTLKLLEMESITKTTPWHGAANVNLTLTLKTVLMATSRLFGEITRDKFPVKPMVAGKDPDGSKRDKADNIREHFSYDLYVKNRDVWYNSLFNYIYNFFAVGTSACYLYWNYTKNSVCYQVLDLDNWAIDPDAMDVSTARFSLFETLTFNEIKYYINSEEFIEYDFKKVLAASKSKITDDANTKVDFIKQGRLIDLDGDDYAEPYLVTVDTVNRKVVKIKKNFVIKAEISYDSLGIETITSKNVVIENDSVKKVLFLEPLCHLIVARMYPYRNSNIYGLGLGQLLYNQNSIINTVCNQMLDSGTANLGGGFIDQGCKIQGGTSTVRRNEWKPVKPPSGVKLQECIVPHPRNEISPTHIALMEFITNNLKETASMTEIMSGQVPDNTNPLMALTAQQNSLIDFKATYKLFINSLTSMFRLAARLNGIYMADEDFATLNKQNITITREDYSDENITVIPNVDPTVASDTERVGQMMFIDSEKGNQFLNEREVLIRKLKAMNIENIDALVFPPPDDSPSVETLLTQAQISFLDSQEKLNWDKQKLDWYKESAKERQLLSELNRLRNELAVKTEETASKILVNQATAIEKMANAEKTDIDKQLGIYEAKVAAMQHKAEEKPVSVPPHIEEILDNVKEDIDANRTIEEQESEEPPVTDSGMDAAPNNGIGIPSLTPRAG